MTREELDFWGQPPYQCTITNNVGHPLGMLNVDGTFTPVGTSNVGKESDNLIITWDGAKPDSMPNGSTKGRLLPVNGPRYIDSLVAIGFYKRAAQDAENTEADETPQRAKRYVTGPAETNRQKRKFKVT